MADGKVISGVLLKCSSKECGVTWVNAITISKKGALEKVDATSTVGCPNCGYTTEYRMMKAWVDEGFPQYRSEECQCNGCGGNHRWVKVA